MSVEWDKVYKLLSIAEMATKWPKLQHLSTAVMRELDAHVEVATKDNTEAAKVQAEKVKAEEAKKAEAAAKIAAEDEKKAKLAAEPQKPVDPVEPPTPADDPPPRRSFSSEPTQGGK